MKRATSPVLGLELELSASKEHEAAFRHSCRTRGELRGWALFEKLERVNVAAAGEQVFEIFEMLFGSAALATVFCVVLMVREKRKLA